MRLDCEVVREFAVAAGGPCRVPCGRAGADARAATGRDWHDSSRTEPSGKPLIRTTPLAQSLRTAVVILVSGGNDVCFGADDRHGYRATPRTNHSVSRSSRRRLPHSRSGTTAIRREQLEKWIAEFSSWKEWAATWGNRPEPGWFSGSRARRPQARSTLWLFQECAGVAPDPAGRGLSVAGGMERVAACSRDAADSGRPGREHGRGEGDKITWWEHVHLDAGWPALQSRRRHLRRARHARDDDRARAAADLHRAWCDAVERADRGWWPRMENRHELRHRLSAWRSSHFPEPAATRIST